MDEAVLVRCDEEGELAAHVVDGHGNVCLADLLELSATLSLLEEPKLDARVPGSADNNGSSCLRINHAAYTLHGMIMLADRRDVLRVQFEQLDRIVGTSQQDVAGVLLPAETENRTARIGLL